MGTLRQACRLIQVSRECMSLNRCKDVTRRSGTPGARAHPLGRREALLAGAARLVGASEVARAKLDVPMAIAAGGDPEGVEAQVHLPGRFAAVNAQQRMHLGFGA